MRDKLLLQINFRVAFDCDCLSGFFTNCVSWWCCFDVIAGFLSGRVQRVMVDGINSENVRVVSVAP